MRTERERSAWEPLLCLHERLLLMRKPTMRKMTHAVTQERWLSALCVGRNDTSGCRSVEAEERAVPSPAEALCKRAVSSGAYGPDGQRSTSPKRCSSASRSASSNVLQPSPLSPPHCQYQRSWRCWERRAF